MQETEGRMECKDQKESIEDDENVLYLDCGDDLWTYSTVKTHWVVHFEWMQIILNCTLKWMQNYTLCKLFFNKVGKEKLLKSQFSNNFIFFVEL